MLDSPVYLNHSNINKFLSFPWWLQHLFMLGVSLLIGLILAILTLKAKHQQNQHLQTTLIEQQNQHITLTQALNSLPEYSSVEDEIVEYEKQIDFLTSKLNSTFSFYEEINRFLDKSKCELISLTPRTESLNNEEIKQSVTWHIKLTCNYFQIVTLFKLIHQNSPRITAKFIQLTKDEHNILLDLQLYLNQLKDKHNDSK